jgi:hypothetical protein
MRIFELKRVEAIEGPKDPHNEELNNVYSSPDTGTAIRDGRVRWVGHISGVQGAG